MLYYSVFVVIFFLKKYDLEGIKSLKNNNVLDNSMLMKKFFSLLLEIIINRKCLIFRKLNANLFERLVKE